MGVKSKCVRFEFGRICGSVLTDIVQSVQPNLLGLFASFILSISKKIIIIIITGRASS